MKTYTLLVILSASIIVSGCDTTGALVASSNTTVELSEANYSIVATNVTGEATNSYAIGLSTSIGLYTKSFGLIPLGGPKTLYKDARENLWKTFEAQYGEVEDRTLALTNVQYDATTLNLGIYTKATVYITADVIEFE